ncbi:hypothetical protein ACJX0J_015185, partial [Zea mays]
MNNCLEEKNAQHKKDQWDKNRLCFHHVLLDDCLVEDGAAVTIINCCDRYRFVIMMGAPYPFNMENTLRYLTTENM